MLLSMQVLQLQISFLQLKFEDLSLLLPVHQLLFILAYHLKGVSRVDDVLEVPGFDPGQMQQLVYFSLALAGAHVADLVGLSFC